MIKDRYGKELKKPEHKPIILQSIIVRLPTSVYGKPLTRKDYDDD